MNPKNEATLLIFLLIGTVASFYYVHRYESIANGQLALRALIENYSGRPLVLDPLAKTGDCQAIGGLPDHACTPGAVFQDADREKICVKGYTKTVRNVSTSLKKRIYAEYNLVYPQARGAYEADHLIPLELGGNNDIANLFPEAAEPRPGFHEKDLVENYLNEEMCAGHIDLTIAQKLISDNWLSVYNTLTPEQIEILKNEYPGQNGY